MIDSVLAERRMRWRTVALGVLWLTASSTDVWAQERWSNPVTWGGRVPAAGDHVVIPQGRRIVLDVSPPPLGSITVNGVLAFGDTSLDLIVGWIMVHGLLEIGTEQLAYPHRATITLTGPLDDNIMGMGARFIGAMNGGSLELHGARRMDTDWAVLARPLHPGDTRMTIELVEPNKSALGWQPGDLLAIAASGRDPLEAEAVTITAVTGLDVQFTPPVKFHHTGDLLAVAGRTVDERAEVGLLSRNIVIQSAPDGFARQLGGHIMIMAGSIGKIEGVELRHMGQMGRLGRYPIHWHLTGSAPTDYARFNSIWNSFHRGVVVHQTHGVEVRGNVAANVWSHTFVVAEDGNETHNIVEHNLGILTKRLPDSAFVLKRANESGADGPGGQDEWRPATFWINNPNNTVRANRAAGGLDAIGFFYDRDHGRAAPGDLDGLQFAGNVAHSYQSSDALDDPSPDLAGGIGLMVRMTPRAGGVARFESFHAHHNGTAGAWLEDAGDVLIDSVLADNPSGAILFRGAIENGLVVGITGGASGGTTSGIRVIARGGPKAPRVSRTTFASLNGAAVSIESGSMMPGNAFDAIELLNTPTPVMLRDRRADHAWSGALVDADGSLTGSAGATLVSAGALASDSRFVPGWSTFPSGGAFLTDNRHAGSSPTMLSASIEGSRVTLAWYPPTATVVENYILEVGASPGGSDIRTAIGTATTRTFDGVPAGDYFVRVRAESSGTESAASNEVRISVGLADCFVPDAPVPLAARLDGRFVRLEWPRAAGASGYVLGAGSAADRYDLLSAHLPSDTTALDGVVPPGVYFVRVAAFNRCGVGRPSNEMRIVVY